jgi:hypothetical protein
MRVLISNIKENERRRDICGVPKTNDISRPNYIHSDWMIEINFLC